LSTVSVIALFKHAHRLKEDAPRADYQGMSGTGYDPKIIERFADQLLRKADTVRVGFAAGGGIFGVFVGAVPMTPLKSLWGVPPGFGIATIIVGALLGILVGYVIGEGRAFRYRVQAQSAIFQLEIERRVSSAVSEAVVAATAQLQLPTASPPPVDAEPQQTRAMPPLSPVASKPEAKPEPVREAEPEPEREPVRTVEPLLRPPGEPGPPVSPRPDEPPLSPAAHG
jgi:hypothetical protein